jgi:PAS domain S-box-containing protein
MKCLQDKTPFENIQLQRNKNGDYEWYKVSSQPLFDEKRNIIKWLGISININQEVELNRKLKEVNERLNLSIRSSNSGTWDWDIKTDQAKYNDYWFEMLGYKPGELNTDLNSWLNLLHPDDKNKALKLLNEHIDGKTDYYESIFRIKKSDGSWKWIYDSGKAIERDSQGKALRFIGMQQDYDTRKKAQEVVEENERKMRILATSAHTLLELETIDQIYEHIVDQIYRYIKRDGIVVLTSYFNNMQNWEIIKTRGIPKLIDKITKTLGRPIEGMKGNTSVEVKIEMKSGKLRKYAPNLDPTVNESLKSVVTDKIRKILKLDEIFGIGMVKNEIVYGSISIIQKDDEMDLDAQFIETLVYQASSAIERKSAEKELRIQNKELTDLNRELDLVIQGLSHDLKSPIHTTRGILEMHSLDPESMPVTELSKQVYKSLNKLDMITNDLLGIVLNNRSDVEKEEIDFKKLIDDAISEQENVFIFREINWERDFNQKSRFYSDTKRLKLIIRNLLSNAIKYQDAKKDKKWIKITVTSDSQKANIKVSDNGIGMRKEQLEKIFDMFYRGDNGREGIGLGLNIIKQTLDKLGGSVEVNSEHRNGSEFTVTIPNIDAGK